MPYDEPTVVAFGGLLAEVRYPRLIEAHEELPSGDTEGAACPEASRATRLFEASVRKCGCRGLQLRRPRRDHDDGCASHTMYVLFYTK